MIDTKTTCGVFTYRAPVTVGPHQQILVAKRPAPLVILRTPLVGNLQERLNSLIALAKVG